MIESAFAKGTILSGAEIFFTEVGGGSGKEISTGSLGITVSWTEKHIFKKNVAHNDGAIFLPYCPNGINTTVATGADVISSKFSGCWMVKYTDGGGAWVGHVATPECNDEWNQIKSRNGVQVLAEFKPTDHSDVKADMAAASKFGGNAGTETLGLITGDNRCFAIIGTRVKKSGVTTLHVHKRVQV